ncbi:hypothetical protein C8R42DRAFT_648967 [Lentinula raphanica]|nr:hypothetical protein C8R42DRAFT_648967 [Lentinula raphanica]
MSRYSTSSLGILSTRNFKRTRNLSAQAKKSYQQFFKKNFKQIKEVANLLNFLYQTPVLKSIFIEVPTAPPSPSPVPQDSRKLRRHETFYYQERTHRNKLIQTDDTGVRLKQQDQEKSADLHQVDLEECYLEVSLQNTPIEDIPKGMSREAFVMQQLNDRRLEGFLALAFGESSSSSSSSGSL